MIALQIKSMKQFMNQLLVADAFEPFLLEEAVIGTACTFTIDGHVNPEFYGNEEDSTQKTAYEFRPWSELKGLCFDLIKGKRTPLSFKFVLLLFPGHMGKILEKGGFSDNGSLVRAFTLTIKYDGTHATLITGLSTNTFMMDKTPEQLWDEAFRKFMDNRQVSWEEI